MNRYQNGFTLCCLSINANNYINNNLKICNLSQTFKKAKKRKESHKIRKILPTFNLKKNSNMVKMFTIHRQTCT